jgi:hypothetical protein
MPTPNQNTWAGLRRKLLLGGAATLMLAVAYPVSFGPAVAVAYRLQRTYSETRNTDVFMGLLAVRAIYRPVVLGIVHLPETPKQVALKWCELWLPAGMRLRSASEYGIFWFGPSGPVVFPTR